MTAEFLSLYEMFATTCHMKRRASGSIPADGSSSKIIGGLPRVAIATDSFLLLPPERVPACLFLWSDKFSWTIAYLINCSRLSSGTPLSYT